MGKELWLLLLVAFIPLVNSQSRPCDGLADLFFAIDGSDSLSDEDFAESKKFIVDVLKAFDVQDGKVHVGANVFGSGVYDRMVLRGPTKGLYQLFELRITTLMRSPAGLTETYTALKEMTDEFQLRGRKNVTRVGIVITDGKSGNLNATKTRAKEARDININMIAIGIGTTFRQELENIASSPNSVYETDDVMKVVATIQEAIKNFICPAPKQNATTTAKPAVLTTPEASGLNDFDCPDCMIDATHGFKNHPHSCEKYIEIIANPNGTRVLLTRKCRDGLFWDQYHSTCKRPEEVKCDIDPCLTSGVISYDIEDLCSGYVMCVNKRSMRACCPAGQAYNPLTGCKPGPWCIDDCHGDNNHLIHPAECDKMADPNDNRFYIQNEGEGHANKTLPCAPGTVFNPDTCMCDLFDKRPQTGKLTDCGPSANFTFTNDVTDSSGKGVYAGTELVDFVNGNAQFNGNGMINIYRFSMDAFAESLVLRIKFKPSLSGKSSEALLTNCVYSTEQRSSVSIRLVRSGAANVVVFSTDTTLGTQEVSVPFNPKVWNVATYIYDGTNLIGVIDDGTSPATVVKAPLSGDVLLRRSGIIIGAGSQLNSFTGSVDEFQLFKCFPASVDGFRA